jgi:hypothetical protein
MKRLYFLLTLFVLPILLLGCKEGEVPEDQEVDYEEIKEIIEEIDEESTVRGSCNVVASKSTCLDYRGSFWTDQQMKLNCDGVGQFSTNTCPYSDRGGCRVGMDTMVESVSWSYGRGGAPLTEENVQYAAGACNALPGAQWVVPDDLM